MTQLREEELVNIPVTYCENVVQGHTNILPFKAVAEGTACEFLTNWECDES